MTSLFWRPTPSSAEHLFWHGGYSVCYFPDYVGYRIYDDTGNLLACANTVPIAMAWIDNRVVTVDVGKVLTS